MFVTYVASATALPSTLGVFFKPMSEEFGWPRAYLSSVRSFESLFTGVVVALLGTTLDRHGARIIMVIGGVIGGIGIFMLGFVNDSVQFFLVRGVLVCVGTAMFGQMITSVTVSNWFVRKRGRALGISGAGQAVGKIFMAPAVTLLMGIWGWREGWMVMGLLVLFLVPVPSFLTVRRRPEDMGQRPDGDEEPVEGASQSSHKQGSPHVESADDRIWTRQEALRSSVFWLIILAFSIGNVGMQGWALHAIPYLTDIGFSPAMAAAAVSIQAIVQVFGNLVWGFLVERFAVRHCASGVFLIHAVGIAILLWLRLPVFSVVGLAIYGISLTGNVVVQDIMWANYFGRLSLGTIRGIGIPILMLVGSAGPLYFGYLYDLTGGYEAAMFGFIIALLVAAGLVLTCRPPGQQRLTAAVQNKA